MKMKTDWDIEAAIATYNVDGWGSGYFSVNGAGNVVAKPLKEAGGSIDMLEVVNEARERGLGFPLVIRFQDLLRHRVETVNRAFQTAMQEFGYRNQYRGVFPIKVNQLREVIEEIVDAGEAISFRSRSGQQTGVVRRARDAQGPREPHHLQRLQGPRLHSHRDARAQARQNGHHRGRKTRGARANDSRVCKGRWVSSPTSASACGCTAKARANGRRAAAKTRSSASSTDEPGRGERNAQGSRDWRIASSSSISTSARRCPTFRRSNARCAKRPVITRSSPRWARARLSRCRRRPRRGLRRFAQRVSTARRITRCRNTANDVVYNIMDVCDSEGVAHPAIVSESGRAIVAHHSVLVVEAFGSIEKDCAEAAKSMRGENDHKLVARHPRCEAAAQARQPAREPARRAADQGGAQQMFNLGLLDLRIKAKIETSIGSSPSRSCNMHRGLRYVPEEVKELETSLGDQYICNFSVFQSLLDHWALGQLFPIMPIHRLTTPPDRKGTLVDITCDSDGKINKFIDLQDVRDTLPLHRDQRRANCITSASSWSAPTRTSWAICTILFGRVTEVHVFLDPDEESGWYIEEVIEGSTIGEVLAMTQWDKIELMRLMKIAGRCRDQDRPPQAERRDETSVRLRAVAPGIHLSFSQRHQTAAATGKLAAVKQLIPPR